MRRSHFVLLGIAISTVLSSGLTLAQTGAGPYPSRPITVIVPYAAGGPIDSETRLYTPKLSELLGQPVIINAKGGAGTSIGTLEVAKAKPDGYTLLATSATLTSFPLFYKDLKFDVDKDLAPITQMSKRSAVLITNPSFPAKTFAEYIAYARANPGKINYAMNGVGDITHLGGAWIHALTRTKVTFVSYRGTGPALIDLLGGHIDVTTATLISALPMIRAGKLRPLGVLGSERSKLLPDVPTIREQGVPEYSNDNWMGVLAPAGTPAEIVKRLNEALVKVARMPTTVANLDAQGSVAVGNTPEQFRQRIVTETARWRKVVDDAGITPPTPGTNRE